jgi:thiamine biosynthesis protein ThiF, family 2
MSLAGLAKCFFPGADLALLEGQLVDQVEWQDTFPESGAEIIFACRGVMPDPESYRRLLLSRNPPGTVERLERAVVGFAGCGGLGSHAALALARLGVGNLVIVDFDTVEPTNLNRQAFVAEDLCTAKVDALGRLISSVNPLATVARHNCVLAPGNIAGIFCGCQVILECLDNPIAKRMFVETVLEEIPETVVVAASGIGGLGPAAEIETRRIMSRLWLVGDGISGVEEGLGLAAPRVMIAAGQQALCAANLLLSCIN